MSLSTITFFIFMLYIVIVVICTFKLLKRVKIINSMWDMFYDLIEVYRRIMSIKWNVSEFPTIDPNDPMLRFVVFSQKRKYYIFFFAVILIKVLPQ